MRRCFGSVILSAVAAISAAAQETYPNFAIAGRLQTQFYLFDNHALPATGSPSNFFLRRVRFQVNGKFRSRIVVASDASNADVEAAALADPKVANSLNT